MNAAKSAALRLRLHDGLCQHLTAALMFSDGLRRGLQARNAPEADDCEVVIRLLQQSADELIEIMSLLADPATPPE